MELTLLVEYVSGLYLLRQTTTDTIAKIKMMPPQIAKTAIKPLLMSGSLLLSVSKNEPICWISVVVGVTGVGSGSGVTTEHAGSWLRKPRAKMFEALSNP